MAKKTKELTLEEKLEQALVPEEEWPYEVPENWCWVRLDVLKEGIAGFFDGDWILSENMDDNGDVRLLQLSDIGVGKFLDKSNKHISNDTFEKLDCTELVEGDVMISRMAEPIARSCIVPRFSYRVITAVDVAVLRCNKHIVRKEYVNHLCNTKWFTDMALNRARGTTRVRITRKNLGEMPVPLAPLAEQQRIVDRIESLFVKLDEVKRIAEEIVDSFEMRKSAILHRAFTGELTAQWRKEHGVERENWRNRELSSFSTVVSGYAFNSKDFTSNGIPCVKITNVGVGEYVPDSYEYLPECYLKTYERFRIKRGDILISLTRSFINAGLKVCIYNENFASLLNQRVGLIKDCNKKYVFYYLTTEDVLNYVKEKSKTTNQPNLSIKDLNNLLVPVPSEEEQNKIVDILEKMLAKEQQAKEAAEAVLDQIDIMKKSILARAFRGELGTNIETEENAVGLLKEILQKDI